MAAQPTLQGVGASRREAPTFHGADFYESPESSWI